MYRKKFNDDKTTSYSFIILFDILIYSVKFECNYTTVSIYIRTSYCLSALVNSWILVARVVIFVPPFARFFQAITSKFIHQWIITITVTNSNSKHGKHASTLCCLVTATIFFFTTTASHIIFRVAFFYNA